MRILAIFGGLLLLALVSIGSAGAVLLAPIGIFVVERILRARGKEVSAMTSWFVACACVALGYVALGTAMFRALPDASFKDVQRAVDSASATAAKKPPPAWLQKMKESNPAAANAPVLPMPKGPTMMIIGGFFLVNMMGGLIGSIGWGCAILLWYGFANRKPWEPPVSRPSAAESAL